MTKSRQLQADQQTDANATRDPLEALYKKVGITAVAAAASFIRRPQTKTPKAA